MSESSPKACPRWQEIIRKAVREGPPGVGHYSLATAVYDATTQRITPFNRTVGHRCFLNEPIEGVGSEGGDYVDERFGSTSTMLFTTDARSQKVREAMQSSGAAVVWYFPNKQLQARLTGSLYVLAHPDHPSVDLFPGSELKPPPLSAKDETAVFDWQRVRLGLFKCLSPSLFAALYRPEPGSLHPHNNELVAADSWPGKNEHASLSDRERPWEVSVDRKELEKRLGEGELKSLVDAAERK
ncbi:hypothetical protein BCV69DRAFT_300306 [Microstroma glucosiphilum]|uniref:Pyridoxamine 5'-phosphate oxidase Alr4036 family FMN-binding domain-containing protein n=1 Tax=Pseudomicrostroma glucosiphilum TaxID=1684307 RepID=A0A316U4S9_9BASI|nr:hypothetical protein BCV69DRAFT_300306 [Pseudomicrostroma glucosiphilum]PWN19481.1 hypothetical protein BCV69DRAFT_300306 [Pseudomicrostroma glucosiphilum]